MNRPYSPAIVKRAIVQRVANHPLTARQTVDHNTLIEVCEAFHIPLPGNRGRVGYCTDTQRRAITAWLCDLEGGHAKDLSQAQARALIEWLSKKDQVVPEMIAILTIDQFKRTGQLKLYSEEFDEPNTTSSPDPVPASHP